MKEQYIKTSKFLSYVLRHRPDEIGLTLDAEGWASVSELIANAALHGTVLTEELIRQVVADNDKQRFALSEDRTRIRASQGHSVNVDLKLPPTVPPEILYHGTADRFVKSIREGGLHSGSRRQVHLSTDEKTAVNVGGRHGRPVVLRVKAGLMHQQGHVFNLSANGVWLTDAVPAEFIE